MTIADARAIAQGASMRRLDHIRWTVPQLAFLADASPIVLNRGGNQIGKTTSFLADLIWRCRGAHPYQALRHKPPINALLLSESWDQMGQAGGFQEKLWELLPGDELDDRIQFDPGRGITGKPPRIVFTSGPGKGSVITLGTFQQGSKRVAGSTVHYVGTDEPPPPGLFGELVPRLFRYGGVMRINFTPVLGMPDQTALRELVASGRVSEHNPHLDERSCWPVGAPRPWRTQADIDEMIGLWDAPVRPMRVEGSWDPVSDRNWLSAWDATRHIRRDSPPAGARVVVGIDHGAQAGKQAACVVAFSDLASTHPYIWFLGETVGDGRTSMAEDAAAIGRMLREAGLTWADVDVWVGDRSLQASRANMQKSNRILREHLADHFGLGRRDFPDIETAVKGPGSVELGLRKWNKLLATNDYNGNPHVIVHPRCPRIAAFCGQWSGDSRDPKKDIGDAARYAINRMVADVADGPVVRRW